MDRETLFLGDRKPLILKEIDEIWSGEVNECGLNGGRGA